VEKCLSLFLSQITEFICTENKLDSKKEITFPRSIPANDDVMLWTEWFNNSLIPIAPEALNDNLKEK